jgi:hypothetical protein
MVGHIGDEMYNNTPILSPATLLDYDIPNEMSYQDTKLSGTDLMDINQVSYSLNDNYQTLDDETHHV